MSLKKILFFTLMATFLSLSVHSALFPAEADNNKIPVIHVKGSHYDVGHQIGTQMKTQLRELVQHSKDYVLKESDQTWEDIRTQSRLLLEYSKNNVPEFVEEIKGAADATEIDLVDLFAEICGRSMPRTIWRDAVI
ncbi:hypothetical protein ACFLT2_05440 [Acidobacteriota bacterium]